MTTPQAFSVGKDILLGIAAIVTAGLAWKGLNRWSAELKGKSEFEVARNLIRATYKLRDAIQSCRNPLMSIYKDPEGGRDNPVTSSTKQEQEAEALAYAYNNRMQPVWDALRELDLHTLGAEVLWGKEIRLHTDKLRHSAHRLFIALQDFIADKKSGGKDSKQDEAYAKLIRKTVYDSWDEEDNEFSKKITSVITEIETIVRPHLYNINKSHTRLRCAWQILRETSHNLIDKAKKVRVKKEKAP